MARKRNDQATETAERPARRRQGFLPDMEPPRIKEIDEAAEQYADLRDARMRKGEQEKVAQVLLMGLMKKHTLTTYDLPDGRKVEVVADEKVKVRQPKEEE